jgi:FkbM family methyltransferase
MSVKDAVRKLIRTFGYDVRRYRPQYDLSRRFQLSIQRRGVTVVLDVGANIGQFARSIRKAGYNGRIISFEPLSDAHAKLLVAAQRDPLWNVAPRCAVGASHGEVQINIAANSQSSSILNILERHIAGDRGSGYIGQETVTVNTLDSFLDGKPDLAGTAIALKLDTQGYEMEVLAGLDKWSANIEVIMTEMSLARLYQRQAKFVDLYQVIEKRGYRCISIEPAFTDSATYEVLQVDAIFER